MLRIKTCDIPASWGAVIGSTRWRRGRNGKVMGLRISGRRMIFDTQREGDWYPASFWLGAGGKRKLLDVIGHFTTLFYFDSNGWFRRVILPACIGSDTRWCSLSHRFGRFRGRVGHMIVAHLCGAAAVCRITTSQLIRRFRTFRFCLGFVDGFGILEGLIGAGRASIGAAEGFHGALAVRYSSSLSNDKENSGVADDDGYAGEQESHNEEELFGRMVVTILQNGTRAHLFIKTKHAPLTE